MEESGQYLSGLLDLQDARATTVKLSPPDDQPQNNSTSNNGLLELLFFHSECIPSPKLPNINQVGLSHFALTVNDLDLIYKQLSEKGIRFLSSPQASPDGYAKVAFCRDPDGCLIELVELMKNWYEKWLSYIPKPTRNSDASVSVDL